MRARARSIWASFSRSFWTTMISWTRSKLVAPMSAWSWPAPSPASRISLSSSASWPDRVRTTRSRSECSSDRTSLISALVQASSPSLTTRALTALRADPAVPVLDRVATVVPPARAGVVFFAGAFVAGAFVAGAFVAGTFFAGAFVAGTFFAGAFVAGAFFAGAFVAGAFFAGAFFAGAAL